jgi:hypothetical protein
VPGE